MTVTSMNPKIALKTLDSQEWETPQDLFNRLDQEFHFNLDPCASKENAKCGQYFDEAIDGLCQKWSGNVFMNPPFRQVAKWVEKAFKEVVSGRCNVAVYLVPNTSKLVLKTK